MLQDTQPWLLALTGVVSVLHTVFDCLAFKNDISFWKNNKSTAGVCVGVLFIDLLSV